MNMKHRVISVVGSALAIALALVVWLPVAARAAQHAQGAHGMMQMEHITTQAQAEALKPGDAMFCSATTPGSGSMKDMDEDQQ